VQRPPSLRQTTNDSVSVTPFPEPLIRILIIKEQDLFAECLRLHLDGCPDIEVVGTVGTAAAGMAEIARLHPDVVLLDCELPGDDGISTLEDIKRTVPASKVVIVAGPGNERLAARAIDSGCSGVLGRFQSVEQLLAVVHAAYAGETVMIPSVLLRHLPPMWRQCEGLGADLSPRELEVLSAMAHGASDRAVAKELFISLNTARKHTHHIIQKLGVHSKLEAVVVAAREGLIRPL